MGKKTEKKIPSKLFFKIGEVCELTETQPYVLRYWESEFPGLAPAKNNSGQRIYRRRDIDTILRIKALLYEEGFTIAGAKKKLEIELKTRGSVGTLDDKAQAPQVGEAEEANDEINKLKTELRGILEMMKDNDA